MRHAGTVHPLIAFARPLRAFISDAKGAGARHSGTSRLRTRTTTFGLLSCLVLGGAVTAKAQFKEVGPPPIPPTAAREQVRTLLEKVDPGNRRETVATISGLLTWYRDLIDEELAAAWRKDGRSNLPEVIEALADGPLASAIVEFSWRQQRQAAFVPAYAPMLGHLMARYPDSATLFLDDLIGAPPDLSPPQAETVCRILLDMPDLGTWKQSALQILPHYRRVAETLLDGDIHVAVREKSFSAQRWLVDLKKVDSAFAVQGDAGAVAPARVVPAAPVIPSGPNTTRSSLLPKQGEVLTSLDPALVDDTYRSVNGNTPAFIDFVNRSSGPVDIYWINYKGDRGPNPVRLPVGGTSSAGTFLTHPFLVVVADTGGTNARDTGTRMAAFQAVTPNPNRDPAIRDTAIISDPSGTSSQRATPAPTAGGPGTMGPDGVYRTGDGVSQPTRLSGEGIAPTELARKLGVRGEVDIAAVVEPDGTVRDVRLVRQLGYGLDEKGIEAAQKWRFRPALKDGNPVPVLITIGLVVSPPGPTNPGMWSSGPMVFALEAGVTPPVVRDGTMPKPSQQDLNESVVLEFTVDSKGVVKNIRAASGTQTSSDLLSGSLATWKFRPAMKGALAVEATGTVRFVKEQGDGAANPPPSPPPSSTGSPVAVPAAPVSKGA